MPISPMSSRNDFVDMSLLRISVSLCCTNGCSTTVTPSIFLLPGARGRLKYRSVANNLDRWTSIRAALARDCSAGRPRAAFENFGKRQGAGIHVQFFADCIAKPVEQGDGQGAPFDYQPRANLVRICGLAWVAQEKRAGIDEQPAVAIFGKSRETIDIGHRETRVL